MNLEPETIDMPLTPAITSSSLVPMTSSAPAALGLAGSSLLMGSDRPDDALQKLGTEWVREPDAAHHTNVNFLVSAAPPVQKIEALKEYIIGLIADYQRGDISLRTYDKVIEKIITKDGYSRDYWEDFFNDIFGHGDTEELVQRLAHDAVHQGKDGFIKSAIDTSSDYRTALLMSIEEGDLDFLQSITLNRANLDWFTED